MDVQLMANRLARLKSEEQQALRKVDAMRKQADQTLSNKQRNYKKYQMKFQHAEAEYKALRRQQEQQQYLRAQQRDNMRATREMVLREKRDKAMAIKQAKRENEWLVAKFKEEEVHRNRVSRDVVKTREEKFKNRLRQSREHHTLHLEEETNARIEEEMYALKTSESGITAMQLEERRLIESLKAVREEEHGAYRALQATNEYDPFTTAFEMANADAADAAETGEEPMEPMEPRSSSQASSKASSSSRNAGEASEPNAAPEPASEPAPEPTPAPSQAPEPELKLEPAPEPAPAVEPEPEQSGATPS